MSCACLVIDIVVVLWSHHHTNQPNHLTSGDDLLRCYCNTVVQMGYACIYYGEMAKIEWVEIMLEYCYMSEDKCRQICAQMSMLFKLRSILYEAGII